MVLVAAIVFPIQALPLVAAAPAAGLAVDLAALVVLVPAVDLVVPAAVPLKAGLAVVVALVAAAPTWVEQPTIRWPWHWPN